MAKLGEHDIASGKQSVVSSLDKTTNVDIGEVIDVNDPKSLGRIKVRIKGQTGNGGDDKVSASDLPWAFPMIPKFFSSQPKVGEAVFILTFSSDKKHADRMYIGPIISQSQQLDKDPLVNTALRGFTFGMSEADQAISNGNNNKDVVIPELIGVFPNQEDISVQGRYNTDITQKHNEIVIRAGKFETYPSNANNPYNFRFNSSTQAYIQIKNDIILPSTQESKERISAYADNGLKYEFSTENRGTVTNIVSNKINLLTHVDGSPRFNLTNQTNLISDDELNTILTTAHQLPFGDILLEYLKLLKQALLSHVHNGHGKVATDLTSGNKQALSEFIKNADRLENQMLSKNIRIN